VNNRTTTYLRVILIWSFFVLLSVPTFAQKSGVKGALDYTSNIVVNGTAEGINNLGFNNETGFAGIITGTLNGQPQKFYCIDLAHTVNPSQHPTYWDEGTTPSEMTYILNNYFPYKTSYTGKLSDINKEAAAVQLSIWHFSDGLDVNTISDETVKNRTIAIIADATANHNNTITLQSLVFVPASQSLVQGTNATFDVYALDLNGNPIENLQIALSKNLGTLSATSEKTNSDGRVGPITLSYNGTGTATVKAQATVKIAQGTIYVDKSDPNGKQKLVLATPTTDVKEINSTITWYTPGIPGTCDTKGFTTFTQGGWGGPSNSTPGKIRDLYFSTVFPSGLTVGGGFKLTLTSTSAVKNYLPDGGTAAAYTQNYNNPTSKINILSGQLTALKLNVAYDAAGKIGNNATNLGDLSIATGPFTGMTVNSFLAFAEAAIGGGSLNGHTFSEINDAATSINENFDNGTVDKGFLTCSSELKASLGDRVWEDTNKNGLQDNGENGVQNVTVKLYDCSDNLISTKTTDANGLYLFSNLTPGNYYVQFVLPSGYVFTTKDSGTNNTVDSDADITNGKTICTTLSAGENDLTWDAGIYKEVVVCNNTIGSYVYRDLNVNGTKDTGEAGIAGVIVELVQGTTVTPTTTDVNGHYSFTNVLNGTYTVRIAASNFTSGGAFYNTAQTKWYTKNSSSINTTLSCNDNLSINFGYYKTCVTITKSADKQSYNKGETITYSFLVENCGDIQLHGGIDIFDAMLNTSGNHLIKHIDVLDPHQSTTFTMSYVTGDGDCGQLVNTARAEGHPVNGSATVIDESTWTVNIICQDKADIKIEKTVDNANPKCDDNVTFTIKATNLGPNTATGVQVSDLLPTGLDYVSSSASHGSYSNTTGIWNIGTIANGAFETLTITVKVDCGNINNSTFNLGTAKDYNLFVIEDAIQPSSDTQGKVAVGRDAQFANYSVGDQLPANSGDVLVVGRDLTYTSGAVYSGNVVYGHSTNLPLSMVSIAGGSLRKDTPINFAAEKVYLENLSTTLSAYTVNGTTTSQWGGLTLTGSDPFLNIFSVSGSVLSTANNFEINVPNGSVVLINVDGTNVSWTGGLVVNGTAISNVLYNFYQATSLTISGIDVRGTILAPFAAVNFASGVLNGQMICKSLTGMGQFNFVMFGGQIPFEKKVINVASVSSCLTPDPDSSNNSSSATVTISNTSTGTGSTGNNGNNGNGTWTNVSSFAQGEIVYTMLYDGGNIYAGTWGGKIYKSTDAGKNWSRVNNGMNVSFIWSLIKFNGSVYAATEKGVFKFDGTTAVGLDGKDIHALATDGTTLYAGTWGFGVFKSTNGTTWTELNNNTFGGFLAIQSLTIKGNELFAGTAGGGIFKSTDGMNFSKLTCGYSVIWSLASTSTTLFSGTYGNGLYRSDDNGISFTKVTSLDITFVYSISVDLSGKIYVSSLTNGVFVSSDNGATWTSLGMSGNGVSSMMVNPNSSDVYVGTKEGKVFAITSSNSITAVEDNAVVPTEFKLAQNYPNPFNPTTTIEFAVPKAGVYSLKVYNVLGEEVANLVDNQLSVGQHKVNFDASRLASGMYIYRLSGSNVNISKKMILMK